MRRALALCLSLSLAALAAACQTPANDAADAPLAARIGDDVVSVDELDAYIKDELFERETRGGNASRLHEVRAQAVEQLVKERALERAAAERGTSVEALVAAEREAFEVGDDAIASFYAANRAQLRGATLEQTAPRIREHLAQQGAIDAIVASIGHEVLLERPRIELQGDGPSKGPADAPVTIVEFSDFQCPYCARALPLLERVAAKYPEEVRIVYRHLPLDSIHPQARAGAEASACAADAGRFWEYHDLLFANARALSGPDLLRYAEQVGLDAQAFEACLSSRKHKAAVEADVREAARAGITGTPAFVVNGIVLFGLQSEEALDAVIRQELERLGS